MLNHPFCSPHNIFLTSLLGLSGLNPGLHLLPVGTRTLWQHIFSTKDRFGNPLRLVQVLARSLSQSAPEDHQIHTYLH